MIIYPCPQVAATNQCHMISIRGWGLPNSPQSCSPKCRWWISKGAWSMHTLIIYISCIPMTEIRNQVPWYNQQKGSLFFSALLIHKKKQSNGKRSLKESWGLPSEKSVKSGNLCFKNLVQFHTDKPKIMQTLSLGWLLFSCDNMLVVHVGFFKLAWAEKEGKSHIFLLNSYSGMMFNSFSCPQDC